MSIVEAFYSLAGGANKIKDPAKKEITEGVFDAQDELSLDISDEELIKLSREWNKKWNEYYNKDIKEMQEQNEKYWLGKHYEGVLYKGSNRPIQDNVIFEALETFLPMANKAKPEPLVTADNTDEGNNFSKSVQKMLVYHADRLRLKLRLKRVLRYWAIYLLGVAKLSWSESDNDIAIDVLRPQTLILDPDATIDDDMEYTGEYIGQYKDDIASILAERFPEQASFINEVTKGKLGSKVKYIEWWSDEYVFWTYMDKVLGKAKNPHYNYEKIQLVTDKMGNQSPQVVTGSNHFTLPKMPFVFLSVFNLGKHPYDDTSLIGQNLSNQDIINKRNKQIDRNVDEMNGGWVVSGANSGLTREQASQASDGIRKGATIYIPEGEPRQAIERMTGTGLPADVYQDLKDKREELKNIFGIKGSTAQGTIQDRTVRGKAQIKMQDQDRVGGQIVEYIEQFADQVYNWMVQMMYVYYDQPHSASIIGSERAVDFVTVKNSDFKYKLTVSVREGSLLPKDEASKAEQAIALGMKGMMDPVTMYDRLDFSNPRESAKKLYLWRTTPEMLFQGDAQIAQIEEQKAQMVKENAAQEHEKMLQLELLKHANKPAPASKPAAKGKK